MNDRDRGEDRSRDRGDDRRIEKKEDQRRTPDSGTTVSYDRPIPTEKKPKQ